MTVYFKSKKKIKDNAYKLYLVGEYNISTTFDMSNLSLFDIGKVSRMNPFEERENDEDQRVSPSNLIHVLVGPIAHARAKRTEEMVNRLI